MDKFWIAGDTECPAVPAVSAVQSIIGVSSGRNRPVQLDE